MDPAAAGPLDRWTVRPTLKQERVVESSSRLRRRVPAMEGQYEWVTGPGPPGHAPAPDALLLVPGSGHLREGRGISAPSPPRPLPASSPGVLSRPQPDGRDPAGLADPEPRSRDGGEPAGPRRRRLGGSRPRLARGPSALGCPRRARSGRPVPGIPVTRRELARLHGGRGERAGSGGRKGVHRCQVLAGVRRASNRGLQFTRRGAQRAAVSDPPRAAMTDTGMAMLGLCSLATAAGRGRGKRPLCQLSRGRPGAAGTFILTQPSPGSA